MEEQFFRSRSGFENKIPVVEFSHVSLTYKGTSDTSLSDINFCAKKGQTIGIIGGTGSGKSSLVNLIPRFYDATDGTVKINGRDIKEYQTENLREHIGVVLQKAVLFKGSIADNLRWERKMQQSRKCMKHWTFLRQENLLIRNKAD